MSKITELLGDLEQLETMYSQIARLTGSYYKDLKTQGLPDELTSDLVRDFHSEWWQNIFCPPGNNEKELY